MQAIIRGSVGLCEVEFVDQIEKFPLLRLKLAIFHSNTSTLKDF